jgi:hypothetical protein
MQSMIDKHAIDERQEDEVQVLNLRERYATDFLAMYADKRDGFLQIVAKDEKKFISQIAMNKAHWKKELKRLQPLLKQAWPDISLTPISVCSQLLLETYYTDTVGLSLSYQSKLPFVPEVNNAVFCAVYDYAAGFREIILNMLRAEIMTKNTDPHKLAKDVQGGIEMAKHLWDTTPPIEAGMAVYEKLQTEEAQFTDLLEKDATGRMLLSYLVSLLEDRTHEPAVLFSPTSGLFEYQTSLFVLAGARFAEQAYRALYPLAR